MSVDLVCTFIFSSLLADGKRHEHAPIMMNVLCQFCYTICLGQMPQDGRPLCSGGSDFLTNKYVPKLTNLYYMCLELSVK